MQKPDRLEQVDLFEAGFQFAIDEISKDLARQNRVVSTDALRCGGCCSPVSSRSFGAPRPSPAISNSEGPMADPEEELDDIPVADHLGFVLCPAQHVHVVLYEDGEPFAQFIFSSAEWQEARASIDAVFAEIGITDTMGPAQGEA